MVGIGSPGRDPAEHRIGNVLRDRYQIVGVIGAGGMATVYLAIHRNGNRVALKMLRPELSGHAAHRERFVREAYVANSLDHPGAVRVIDDDVADDGCPFLVMELLHGETLEARYRRNGQLAPREVLAVGHALCDVLARAHACGVVHRDIKPDNIFLTTQGELKILDFGIARVRQDGRESATRTGHTLGTPAYMPPEQALGRRTAIDGRSDLWAVGATMFALISGRAVHQADAPEEMIVRSATVPAPGLATVAPDVPPSIAAVVDRALAFHPEQRFTDAAAMRSAIAAAHLTSFAAAIETTPLPRGQATLTARSNAATLSAETLTSDPGRALTIAGPGTNPSLPAATRVDLATSGTVPLPAAPPPQAELPSPPPPPLPSPPPPRARPRTRALGVVAAILLTGSAAAIAAQETTPSPCTRNADCAAHGAPAICREDQGRCVALTTEHCRVLADPADIADDTTLWIGAMYPIRDPSMDYGLEASRCVELARQDFAGLTGGLPPTRPGGHPRPIGVVMCDDTTDHETIAAHLVDDVGVPAILGFGRSQEVLELANRHFVPKGVLALASNTAAMLSSIPHPPGEVRLVYRMTTSATMIAPPIAALVRQLVEPSLRAADGPPGPTGTLRIAIVRSTNASGTSHTDALYTALAETRQAAPGSREEVRQFPVDDAAIDDPALFAKAAAEVAAFAPHIVLDGGSITHVLPYIEQAWTTGPRPRYVYGGVDLDDRRALVRAHPDITARFHTISTRDNPTVAKVAAQYMAAHGGSAAGLSPTPYDAFYVLAYAAIAVGDDPITGRSLAAAIRRLQPPGEPIEVGPAGIYPALKTLGRGGNIDLRGTLTTLDFDPETGDATADFTMSCLTATGELLPTNTHYDARTRTFTDVAPCS